MAWSRSRISAEPESPPVTCRAGQPMLMSMMSAPKSCATRAPSAIQWASRPASWMTKGRTVSAPLARRTMSGRALTSSSLATISVTTSPAPWAWAITRNGSSVTPDMGARNTLFLVVTGPISMLIF